MPQALTTIMYVIVRDDEHYVVTKELIDVLGQSYSDRLEHAQLFMTKTAAEQYGVCDNERVVSLLSRFRSVPKT
jgi:hypothetical protein